MITSPTLNGKTEQTDRNASADILKALAIVAVVFIHGANLIPYKPTNFDLSKSNSSLIFNSFRFCVPVFIFIWAYFQEKSIIKKGLTTLKPRLYRLFIPFAFWSSLYFVRLADFEHLNLSSTLSKHWSGYGWSGQYYFIILFQLIFLYPIIRMASLKLIKFPALAIASFFIFYILVAYSNLFNYNIVNKISYRPFVYWLPYVTIGIIYAHRNIFKLRPGIYIGFLSLLIIPAEIYWLRPNTEETYLLPSTFVSSLLLCGAMMSREIKYERLKPIFAKPIHVLANNTLGIFCINPLVIDLLSPVIKGFRFYFQFPGSSVLMPVISVSLITGICLILTIILKHTKMKIVVS